MPSDPPTASLSSKRGAGSANWYVPPADDGDDPFEVTDAFGNVRSTVTADSDGVFWRARRLPQVAAGEYVCSVGTDIDRY